MFNKIFRRKRRSVIYLKRSASVGNVSLNGKIVIGHCRGHNTIILLFSIDGFKEKTVRLYFGVE